MSVNLINLHTFTEHLSSELDFEVMRRHGMESQGHNCYRAIKDKGFHNLDSENKRTCQGLAQVLFEKYWNPYETLFLDCLQLDKAALE